MSADASGQRRVSTIVDELSSCCGELVKLCITWIVIWVFAVVQAEAEGLGEGHSHGLPERWPQEGGQARRLGRGGAGTRGGGIIPSLQMVILRLQVLHYGLRWKGMLSSCNI